MLRIARDALLLTLVSSAVWAADPIISFDLPQASLTDSLRALGTQAHINVLYDPPVVAGLTAQPIKARVSVKQALERLLKNTGLEYEFVSDRTVTIHPVATAAPDRAGPGPAANEGNKISSGRLPVPRADSGQSAEPAAVGGSTSSSQQIPAQPVLQEIIVTAQKRAERSQDVPMSLTALNGENLLRSQEFRLEDFVATVPGLTLIDNGAIGSQLVIRGLTSGYQAINSSVATYIDETPYTAEGPFAGSFLVAPNLDTYDMQRIEVLRGPQGTLYGANAMGGLLKYVTNAPDTRGFSASAESGVSSVYNGSTGFDVHAMANIPIGSAAAVRFVGYDNYHPGFVDDPSRNANGVNSSRFSGGRGSILIEPTDGLSVRLTAFYQKRQWNDWSNEDVSPVTLQPLNRQLSQERLIGQPGHATTGLYNATINWDAGFASLISTTSYATYKLQYLQDYSLAYGDLVSSILLAPYGVAIDQTLNLQTLTQEVRLASKTSRYLDWQIGGYFTNASAGYETALFPIDPASRNVLYGFSPNLSDYRMSPHYREYATFINLDQHVTSTFDISLGARYSHNGQRFDETSSGLFGSMPVLTNSSEGVLTYSVGGRWKFSPEAMLYARIAEGFVPGGPNDVIPFVAQLPGSFASSTATNYELGIKTSWLDQHLSAELSVFHIDWRKIQVLAQINGFGSVTNGGTAQSDGIEWNLSYLPLAGLSLNLNGAYTDARLTEATPESVGGRPGDRLPSVPLWEASASTKYERALEGAYTGFVGLDWRFTGDRYAEFEPTTPRQRIPSYRILDARLGVDHGDWTATVYAKNLANKVAINYVQDATLEGGLGTQSATVYEPRTFGLTLSAKF